MRGIRAFVALNLPVRTVQQVVALQDRLRDVAREAGARVAWVPPPNMHVTLKFLGRIPEEVAPAVADALAAGLAGRPPLELTVAGVGAFPSPERPRVLWVGVEGGGGSLSALAADVDGWLAGLGFEPEKRPFHGHLTLGRVREGGGPALIAGEEGFSAGRCRATEVVLYSSVLAARGAEYRALSRVPLAGAGGRERGGGRGGSRTRRTNDDGAPGEGREE